MLYARIISDCDFRTIHLKIIIMKKAVFMTMICSLMSFFLEAGPGECDIEIFPRKCQNQ